MDFIENGTDARFLQHCATDELDLGRCKYSHELAKRLYVAGSLDWGEAQSLEQRKVGYLLYRLGGIEAMIFHRHVVFYVLYGNGVWPGVRNHEVSGYGSTIEFAFDGIGGWMV